MSEYAAILEQIGSNGDSPTHSDMERSRQRAQDALFVQGSSKDIRGNIAQSTESIRSMRSPETQKGKKPMFLRTQTKEPISMSDSPERGTPSEYTSDSPGYYQKAQATFDSRKKVREQERQNRKLNRQRERGRERIPDQYSLDTHESDFFQSQQTSDADAYGFDYLNVRPTRKREGSESESSLRKVGVVQVRKREALPVSIQQQSGPSSGFVSHTVIGKFNSADKYYSDALKVYQGNSIDALATALCLVERSITLVDNIIKYRILKIRILSSMGATRLANDIVQHTLQKSYECADHAPEILIELYQLAVVLAENQGDQQMRNNCLAQLKAMMGDQDYLIFIGNNNLSKPSRTKSRWKFS